MPRLVKSVAALCSNHEDSSKTILVRLLLDLVDRIKQARFQEFTLTQPTIETPWLADALPEHLAASSIAISRGMTIARCTVKADQLLKITTLDGQGFFIGKACAFMRVGFGGLRMSYFGLVELYAHRTSQIWAPTGEHVFFEACRILDVCIGLESDGCVQLMEKFSPL